MDLSDLSYYRESEDITALSWQNRNRSEVLRPFDNTTANLPAAPEIGELGGKQAGVIVRAANGAEEFDYTLQIGERLYRTEPNGDGEINEYRSWRDDALAWFNKWL